MMWVNRANGVLLLLTGVLGIISALTHVATDTLSSALLSVYVGGSGALLLRYEFDGAAELRRDFGFMYTYLGRAAFLLLIGNLAWTCRPLGWQAALFTNANALFSAYVMHSHPSFVAGVASATAIGGFDADAGTEMVYTGGGGGSSGGFDPASTAARARARSERADSGF